MGWVASIATGTQRQIETTAVAYRSSFSHLIQLLYFFHFRSRWTARVKPCLSSMSDVRSSERKLCICICNWICICICNYICICFWCWAARVKPCLSSHVRSSEGKQLQSIGLAAIIIILIVCICTCIFICICIRICISICICQWGETALKGLALLP